MCFEWLDFDSDGFIEVRNFDVRSPPRLKNKPSAQHLKGGTTVDISEEDKIDNIQNNWSTTFEEKGIEGVKTNHLDRDGVHLKKTVSVSRDRLHPTAEQQQQV